MIGAAIGRRGGGVVFEGDRRFLAKPMRSANRRMMPVIIITQGAVITQALNSTMLAKKRTVRRVKFERGLSSPRQWRRATGCEADARMEAKLQKAERRPTVSKFAVRFCGSSWPPLLSNALGDRKHRNTLGRSTDLVASALLWLVALHLPLAGRA